jgi:threonylcarbamoyladenosine tRNA methylthiotransferase MtaB
MPSPTFSILTFGCKVNQYESQAIRERLLRAGLSPVDGRNEAAEVTIVNTCTVTDAACREGLRAVRRLARQHPRALIVATGCAAESNREDLDRIGRVRVFGNADKPGIASVVSSHLGLGEQAEEPLRITRFCGHTRAFLKVQDGCDLRCSFCIVPKVRGGSRSEPTRKIIEEARILVEQGYREIVLTGIHLGSYIAEGTGWRIAGLARELLKIEGLGRLRLSSVEANEIDDELIDLMAQEPRLCPHLHLPLQSGDDSVLQAMRRRYSVRMFVDAVERVRRRIPDPALTTDVIVGFPTESDAAFDRSVELCRKIGFSRIHIFPYSRRTGTEAERLPDLPRELKKDRLGILRNVAREIASDYAHRFIGRKVELLVERQNGISSGYTERYLRAEVPGAPLTANTLAPVMVKRTNGADLLCEVAS